MSPTLWPWWLGGIALAAVMLGHWFLTRRMMAVSGRFTALVDRVRFGKPKPDESIDMNDAELLEALREMTLAEFGPAAVQQAKSAAKPDAEPIAAIDRRGPQTPAMHLTFFGGLVLGGLIAAVATGSFAWTSTLRGQGFAALTGGSTLRTAAILFFGGALVGAGTRMAGGCTSGHGLCGTSRFQPGSIAATCAFFGAGVAVSLLIGAIL